MCSVEMRVNGLLSRQEKRKSTNDQAAQDGPKRTRVERPPIDLSDDSEDYKRDPKQPPIPHIATRSSEGKVARAERNVTQATETTKVETLEADLAILDQTHQRQRPDVEWDVDSGADTSDDGESTRCTLCAEPITGDAKLCDECRGEYVEPLPLEQKMKPRPPKQQQVAGGNKKKKQKKKKKGLLPQCHRCTNRVHNPFSDLCDACVMRLLERTAIILDQQENV